MANIAQMTTERFGFDWYVLEGARNPLYSSPVWGADLYHPIERYKQTSTIKKGVVDASKSRWLPIVSKALEEDLEGQRVWFVFITVYGHSQNLQQAELQAIIDGFKTFNVLKRQMMMAGFFTTANYPGGLANAGKLTPLMKIQKGTTWMSPFAYTHTVYYGKPYNFMTDPLDHLGSKSGLGLKLAVGGPAVTLTQLNALFDLEFDVAACAWGKKPKVNILNLVIGEEGGNVAGSCGKTGITVDTIATKLERLATMGVNERQGQIQQELSPFLGAMVNLAVCTSDKPGVKQVFDDSHERMGFTVLPKWDVQAVLSTARTNSEIAEEAQAQRVLTQAQDQNAES